MVVQVGSPPSTLQVPATPPGINPAPLRNTSNSPVRHNSPDPGRRAVSLNLRQVEFMAKLEANKHRELVAYVIQYFQSNIEAD